VCAIRNTFVEPAPQGDDDFLFESVFGTWPLRAPREHHALEARRASAPEARRAFANSAEGKAKAKEARRASAPGPSTERPPPPLLEEGEILDDECEEGEIMEEDTDQGSPWPTAQINAKEVQVPEEGEVPEEGGQPGARRPPVSVGSLLHDLGTCRPCARLHKSAEGCRYGDKCEFCHLCGPDELQRRRRVRAQLSLAEQVRQQQVLLASGLAKTLSAVGGGALAAAGIPLGVALSLEPCLTDVAPPGSARRPSRASTAHASGQCRPCAWVHKEGGGCKKGSRCRYCHLCPPGELKRRKRQKKLVQMVMEMATAAANVPVEGGSVPFPEWRNPGAKSSADPF